MTRLVRLVLALAGLIIIVAFAIANRAPVDVSFAPLPIVVELPVYGVFLLGLVVGGLLGASAVWLNAFGHRRAARRMRDKVWALENQVTALKKQEQSAQAEGYSTRQALATPRATT
jgi:uncharacterized integral membrane protein